MSEDIKNAIEKYLELRSTKEAVTSAARERAAKLTLEMDEIESKILKFLNDNNVDNVKSSVGTAYKQTDTFVSVKDMDAVIKYVREKDAFELFERKVNKTVVLDLLENDIEVPGVEIVRELRVRVRK